MYYSYIKQLFEDDRSEMPEQEPGENEIEVVMPTIHNLKNGKAIERRDGNDISEISIYSHGQK